MIKVTVLYGHPTDPDAFEQYYTGTHIPLALQMQGVSRVELGKVLPAPDESQPPYYRVAELWFESVEQMQTTFGSPEGQTTLADLANFATGGVTVLTTQLDPMG